MGTNVIASELHILTLINSVRESDSRAKLNETGIDVERINVQDIAKLESSSSQFSNAFYGVEFGVL